MTALSDGTDDDEGGFTGFVSRNDRSGASPLGLAAGSPWPRGAGFRGAARRCGRGHAFLTDAPEVLARGVSFAGFCKTAAGARSSACLNGTHSSDPTIAPRAIGAPGRNFTHPLKGDLSMRGFQRPAPINWPISTHDHRDSSIHLHCLQPPCFSCRPELNTFANGLDETDSSVGVPHVVSYAVPFVLSSLGMPPRRSAQAAGSSRATSSEAGSSSGVSAFFSRMLGRGQGARRGA